jgi:hypothetical protein
VPGKRKQNTVKPTAINDGDGYRPGKAAGTWQLLP